jgi:hypothetical protein
VSVGFQVAGDLALSEDETELLIVAGARSVEQQIRTGSTVWQGYWRYDPAAGLPMLSSVLVKGADLRVVTQVFREWLAEIDGVVTVDSVRCSFSAAARALTVVFKVTCENGESLSSELSFAVG